MDKNSLLNNAQELNIIYRKLMEEKGVRVRVLAVHRKAMVKKHKDYQGNITQIKTIIEKITKSKKMHIY